MKSTWDTYKGKKLFNARYDLLKFDEIAPEVNAIEIEMRKQPLDSVLLLVNATGVPITPNSLDMYKNVALRSKLHVRKTAILGITGARQAVMNIVVKFSGMQVTAFDNELQAKEWLTKD